MARSDWEPLREPLGESMGEPLGEHLGELLAEHLGNLEGTSGGTWLPFPPSPLPPPCNKTAPTSMQDMAYQEREHGIFRSPRMGVETPAELMDDRRGGRGEFLWGQPLVFDPRGVGFLNYAAIEGVCFEPHTDGLPTFLQF
jgi:hypothetical protein